MRCEASGVAGSMHRESLPISSCIPGSGGPKCRAGGRLRLAAVSAARRHAGASPAASLAPPLRPRGLAAHWEGGREGKKARTMAKKSVIGHRPPWTSPIRGSSSRISDGQHGS
ncbi:unnamed protein product [Prorocentrum cordatum]|uniref:Uncharacterized protein n=1 Tax=Prorocentrum cordatum TaxID=2364126 RepID=A0ABN9PLS9_9DINO|nr:unnamed protein product [Polarella glacialis]